jgi:hypothetical protein
MDNSNSKSTNPRDPEYYKDRYPERLTPPVKSAADEVTVAVSKELWKKDGGFSGFIDLSTPRQPPDKDYFIKPPIIYVGISISFRYFKRKDWMFDGSKMMPEELNQIEDAFESFINDVEWEDV